MSKQPKVKDPLKSTPIEKVLYGLGDAGGAIILSFPSAFLTLYLTDSIGMAATFVGTMLLVCRILDGFSDLLMGAVIDKTHTKMGKARPWFVGSIIPMILSFIGLFCMPQGLTEHEQRLYITVFYFLLTVVFYTVNNLSYHALLQRFSLSSQDRTTVSAVRGILAAGFAAAMNIATPILIPTLGGESNPETWRTLVMIWGAAAFVFQLFTALFIKEKMSALVSQGDAAERKNNGDIKKALTSLLHCKYFYIALGLSLAMFTFSNMTGIIYYYCRDVLGNPEQMSILSLMTIVPMLLVMPFVPSLFKKFGRRNTMLFGLILSVVSSVMVMINPSSFLLVLLMVILRNVGSIPLMTAVSTLAGDIADYNQMKTGIRSDGITTSAYSVGVKVGTGLGSAIVAWSLAIGHYDGKLAVQSNETITAIIITFAVIPAVFYLVSAVLVFLWDIEKYQPEVRAFMETQRIDS